MCYEISYVCPSCGYSWFENFVDHDTMATGGKCECPNCMEQVEGLVSVS